MHERAAFLQSGPNFQQKLNTFYVLLFTPAWLNSFIMFAIEKQSPMFLEKD